MVCAVAADAVVLHVSTFLARVSVCMSLCFSARYGTASGHTIYPDCSALSRVSAVVTMDTCTTITAAAASHHGMIAFSE
jgi:hypothetical protein